MKKPEVDYRKLRFSNITSSEYRHLFLLLGWILYFVLYILTENLIPAEKCYPVACALDHIIPFCEWFVIPYVGWYLLIVITILYFAFYSIENFKAFQKYIIVTQLVAMLIYIVFPTRQDLRPDEFTRNNFLTDIVGLLYTADTNTGVCPSLHVAYSLGILSVWSKEKSALPIVKIIVLIFVISVCMSVAFIKQHSVIDALVAVPVCLLAEWVGFGKFYKQRFKRKNIDF